MAKRIYQVQVGDPNVSGGGLVIITMDEDEVRGVWEKYSVDTSARSFVNTALFRAWLELDPDEMQWKSFEDFEREVRSVHVEFPDGIKLLGSL